MGSTSGDSLKLYRLILSQLEEIRKILIAEDPSDNGKLITVIRAGTRARLEMNDNINRLGLIPVTGRWAEFRDSLKDLHQQRAELLEEITETSKRFLSAPQPGVDYGAMMARAPELTAYIENVDKIIFTLSQAMFLALVDEGRLGPDGKLHHLL